MFMLVFRCRKDANSAVEMLSNRELPIKLLGGKIDWIVQCAPRKIKQDSKSTAANDSKIYQKNTAKHCYSMKIAGKSDLILSSSAL